MQLIDEHMARDVIIMEWLSTMPFGQTHGSDSTMIGIMARRLR